MEDEDYEEDEGVDVEVMTMEEHYASMGMDYREHDPNYYCIRQASHYGYYSKSKKTSVYVKRTTLNHPVRIEALRWKAYLNYAKHWDRQEVLVEELEATPDKEAFIPVDEEELKEDWFAGPDGDTMTEEEREEHCRPRRVLIREDRDGSPCHATYDDSFWKYDPPEFDEEVAMEVIAAAGCHGEWELVTLPARIKRAEDPAKLDLGRRYQHEVRRGHALEDKCYLLNRMLEVSIVNSDVLPSADHPVPKMVRVRLNSRLYFFKVGRGGHRSAESNLWPVPDDHDEIEITGSFEPAGT
jgi:hypothetical protein